MQWGGRGIGLLLLLLCAGLALTLQTRVEVPGLSRLLPVSRNGFGEFYHAPSRRNGPNRQPVTEGKVVVPSISNQTVAPIRELSLPKPSSAAPTVTATRAQPTRKTPVTTATAAPSVQSSPIREPSPPASPTASPVSRPRNPNAAVPGENPNAQGAGNARAQAKAKANGEGKGKAGSAPPKTGADSTTP